MTKPKTRTRRTSLKAENAKALKFQCAAKMPPLRHKVGESFDVMKSEVCDWLCMQPEIRQLVFEMAKNTELIEYDPNDAVWHGVDC